MQSILDAAKISLLLPSNLKREQKDWFWEQNVSMDDVDFILISPPEILEWRLEEGRFVLRPKEWLLEDLCLRRCQSAKWHIIQFEEEVNKGVGISYHA